MPPLVNSATPRVFYTAPITKFDYLAGRYLGALAIQLVIFASVGLGAWIATHLPTIDRVWLRSWAYAVQVKLRKMGEGKKKT